MHKKDILLLTTPLNSTFIAHDLAILSKEYTVKVFFFNVTHKYLLPLILVKQLLWMLKNIVTCKQAVTQFGGYGSLIPAILCKIFTKPHFVILHGTDCASLPSVNYGSLRKYVLKQFCKASYRLSTALLPVSASLINVKNTYCLDEETYQGVQHFFSKLKTPIQVVNNGADISFWQPIKKNIKKDPKMFLAVFAASQFYLKGGDLIVNVANHYHDCNFYIAGCEQPDFINNKPKNVVFLGKLSPIALKSYYEKAQFYLQLSMFEGFGLSLCEAMLNRCIPIGSSVNIIPNIIGNSGFVLKHKSIDALKKILALALSGTDNANMAILAQRRIIEHYSLQKRSESLLAVLK